MASSLLFSHMAQIWGQQDNVDKKLQVFQNKALQIMNFQPPRTSANLLLKSCKTLKLAEVKTSKYFVCPQQHE